jgi:hypothetical protein
MVQEIAPDSLCLSIATMFIKGNRFIVEQRSDFFFIGTAQQTAFREGGIDLMMGTAAGLWNFYLEAA